LYVLFLPIRGLAIVIRNKLALHFERKSRTAFPTASSRSPGYRAGSRGFGSVPREAVRTLRHLVAFEDLVDCPLEPFCRRGSAENYRFVRGNMATPWQCERGRDERLWPFQASVAAVDLRLAARAAESAGDEHLAIQQRRRGMVTAGTAEQACGHEGLRESLPCRARRHEEDGQPSRETRVAQHLNSCRPRNRHRPAPPAIRTLGATVAQTRVPVPPDIRKESPRSLANSSLRMSVRKGPLFIALPYCTTGAAADPSRAWDPGPRGFGSHSLTLVPERVQAAIELCEGDLTHARSQARAVRQDRKLLETLGRRIVDRLFAESPRRACASPTKARPPTSSGVEAASVELLVTRGE
jgi:hypothetical protein